MRQKGSFSYRAGFPEPTRRGSGRTFKVKNHVAFQAPSVGGDQVPIRKSGRKSGT